MLEGRATRAGEGGAGHMAWEIPAGTLHQTFPESSMPSCGPRLPDLLQSSRSPGTVLLFTQTPHLTPPRDPERQGDTTAG